MSSSKNFSKKSNQFFPRLDVPTTLFIQFTLFYILQGGFVEVKRPEGRKKRSGVCIGIWLAVGALCAIIVILMAYMAANYLENQSRGLLHKFRLTKKLVGL